VVFRARVSITALSTPATLIDGETPAGSHQLKFKAAGLPSGVYIFRLGTGSLLLFEHKIEAYSHISAVWLPSSKINHCLTFP